LPVLAADPVSEAARELMSRALRGGQAEAAGVGGGEDAGGAAGGWVFDWTAAEKQVGDIVPPVFAGEARQPEPGTEIFSTEKSGQAC
jgi:hypothetical protein